MKAFVLVLALAASSVAFAMPIRDDGDGGCQPDCSGVECGPDGCGDSCGRCNSPYACRGGQCICTPHCSGKQCGSDGCGGSCGTCGAGTACNGSQCVCVPQCSGKQCGPDGCGGSCGTCGDNSTCSGNVCIVNSGGGGSGGGTNGTLITLPLCQEWQEHNSNSPLLSTEWMDWDMFPDATTAAADCNWSGDCASRYVMRPRQGTTKMLDWAQNVTAYAVLDEQCGCGARATCPEVPSNSRLLRIEPYLAQPVYHTKALLQINGEFDNNVDSLVRGEVTYSARTYDGRSRCISPPVAVIEVLQDNVWTDVASTTMSCCDTTVWNNDCATRFDTAVVQTTVPANSIIRMEVRWSDLQNPSYPDQLFISDALLFGAQCFANPDPHGAMCQ